MSTIKTTVRTEQCAFSEFRVYPGRGSRLIARDGKVYMFFNYKCSSLASRHRKPARIRWTQSWRRNHKKLRTSDMVMKKKARKAVKVQKAIEGLTLQQMKAMKVQVKEATAEKAKADHKKTDKKKSDKKQPVGGKAIKATTVPKQKGGAPVAKNFKK